MKNKNNLSILVLSCDKYQDLWDPLFFLFKKYWEDCPFPVYLGSNTIKLYDSRIKTILTGLDKDWSSSLKKILKKISTKYVFIWFDDIFPTEPIETSRFNESIEFMKKYYAKHIHMEPIPVPDRIMPGGKFGVYDPGMPYRVAARGFWDKDFLVKLLLDGESAWDFEIMGSYRTIYTEGFYCTMSPMHQFLHVVEKGKIFPYARDYCLKHDIQIDLIKRKTLDGIYIILSNIKKFYFDLVIKVNWKIRVQISTFLKKLLISY